jgi:Mrp family chromosome partitioning ATPase
VVLVDANMREPGVTGHLGVPQTPGLADLIEGRRTMGETLRTMTDRVALVPSADSGLPSCFDVDNLQVVLGQLATDAIVVVDAPAVAGPPEAMLLLECVDLVLVVVDMTSATRTAVAQAAQVVRSGSRNVNGWITVVKDRGTGRRPTSRSHDARPGREPFSGRRNVDSRQSPSSQRG